MKNKTTYAIATLHHKSKPNYLTLNLRITTNRKPRYKSLNIHILKSHWDKKNRRVYAKHPNHEEINEQLNEVLLNAQSGNISIKKTENSFIGYATQINEGVHTTSSKSLRQYAIKKLQEYLKTLNKEDIQFKDLNNLFIDAYYTWLLSTKIKTSTANEYMQILGQIIDKTEKSGKYRWEVNPFSSYQRKKTSSNIDVITYDEVQKLKDYTPSSTPQRNAINTFFLMMHLNGIRISDILKLTFSNFSLNPNGKLVVKYQIQKNGQTHTTIITPSAALYLCHFLQEYHPELNIELKQIQEAKSEIKDQKNKLQKEYDSLHPESTGQLAQYLDVMSNDELKEAIKKQGIRRAASSF